MMSIMNPSAHRAPVTTERATGPAIVHDGLPARPPLPQWVQTVLMS
jgi:hypothetical protein